MSDYALMTDQYELTMLDAFIADGSVNKRAVFEVFARSLPKGKRYGVFAGLGRLLPMIEEFRFGAEVMEYLHALGLSAETEDYLMDFRFSGTITAYREGEIYFPNSPVLTVEGTLGECVLLETLILSVLNADSAIATTAARMVSSAKGRPVIEMGSRRTNEESAVSAARAAYIAGFAKTSNLLAGYRYGIPTTGTAAHAFTLAHESEAEAFASQIASQGIGTTLLIDTYDVEEGTKAACKAWSDWVDERYSYRDQAEQLGAVRIDSGDLGYEANKVRAILDDYGLTSTRITVTSDLDEYVMKDLQSAPIDGYGVGTKLVSSNPVGFVYKLVAIETAYPDDKWPAYMRPVAKKAKGKVSVGGKKKAYRFLENGKMVKEFYRTDRTDMSPYTSNANVLELQVIVMEDGKVQTEHLPHSLEQSREYHASVKAALPEGEQVVWYGDDFGPYITAEHVGDES